MVIFISTADTYLYYYIYICCKVIPHVMTGSNDDGMHRHVIKKYAVF